MSTTGSSPGATLRAVIYASRRLDELSTARVIEQIAEAVHKQQKGGQALGTLTPDAIFVGADGIELRSGPPKSDYAAPETTGGKPGDRRSDVFSLGAILWEALAHERRTAGAFQAPSELNANVPAELDAICKKALSNDPAQRFPSAKVMAAELATVLEDAGYPEDLSQIVAYLEGAFPPVNAGATLAAKLAAAPAASPAPAPAPAPAPRAALNQTMMGVAPSVVAEALKAAKDVEVAKAAEGQATEQRAKAASAGPVNPLSFVSKTGTMPPPTVLVTPASASTSTDVPLAAPPGPPTQTAPGGGVSGAPPVVPAANPLSTLPFGSTAVTAADLEAAAKRSESVDPETLTTPFARPASTETPSPDTAPFMRPEPAGIFKVPGVLVEPAMTKLAEQSADPSTSKLPGLPPEAATTKEAATEPATAKSGAPEPTTTKVPASIASAETLATPALVPTVDALAPASGVLGLPSLPPGAEPAAASIPSAATRSVADQPTAPVVSKKRAKTSSGAVKSRAGSEPKVDPAAAVSLPFRARRDSQGDMLEKWASTGDALEIDDGHENDILEEQRKQRKRLLVISGGALAAILLIAIIAITFGGTAKPKPKIDEAAVNAPSPTAADPSAKPTDSPTAEPAGIEPPAGSGSAEPAASGSGSGSAEQAVVTNGSADEAAARAAAEQAEADRVAAEKVEADRVAKEAADKKVADDKAAQDAKAEEQRLAKEAAALKAADDKTAKAEKARVAKEEAAATKAASDKAAAEKKAQAAAQAKAQAKSEPKKDPKKDAKKEPKKAQPKQVASAPVDPYTEPKKGDSAALYKQGFQQYVRGDSAGALLTFTDARQANPNYPPTYRGLGLVYEKMGQKEKAKSAFKKYLQLSPDAGDADQIRERMTRL